MEVLFDEISDVPTLTFEEENLDQEYANRVKALIQDAQDYETDTLELARIDNLKYFEGKYPSEPEEGRTKIVSMDARDTVMAVMPSLMRIFGSSENIVNFSPNNPEQVAAAKQATDYIRHIIWEDNPGFMLLYEAFYDATSKNVGLWKWWTDDSEEVKYHEFSNLTFEQFQMLMMEDPNLDVVEIVPAEDSEDPEAPAIELLKVRMVVSKPVHHIETVPPEEFRINRSAKSIEKAVLVGHSRMVSVSDLLSKGYDFRDFNDAIGFTDLYTDEQWIRNPGIDNAVEHEDAILFGEYYIRIDQDGDGIDELRYIRTVGDDYTIIDDEPADYIKFAGICPSPVPHTAVGNSLIEQVKDIQRIRTNLLRAGLDALADSLDPTTVFNPSLTETADILNPEIGKAIRTRGDPMTAVHHFTKPFVGGPALQAYGDMEMMKAARTGISEASKGLDPAAMQSTNLLGIETIVTGAQERIEMVARIFAETGLKHLFKGLLREITNHPNTQRTVQLRGEWVEVSPSSYDASMGIKVNPMLGRGADTVRMQVLENVLARQEGILAKYGYKTPMVTPRNYRNTIEDILELSNIKDVDRYFGELTDEVMDAMMNAPETPDPATVLAEAEMEKVRAQTAEILANKQHDNDKLAMDDDFRRDKLSVDSALKLEELGARQREREIAAYNKANTRPTGRPGN